MPAKTATLKALQNRCKAEGLSTAGTRADLVKRLEKRNREESQPECLDDTGCDAILIARSEVGNEEDMKVSAKDALGQALLEEELHVEDVRGELVVANRRGLSLAGLPARVDAFTDEVTAQRAKIASLEDEATAQRAKSTSLEDRVAGPTSSLEAYKLLRNRFISTFKRDKLPNETEADKRIIAKGNGWAHGGDAVVDAGLYQGVGGRRDNMAFKSFTEWTRL